MISSFFIDRPKFAFVIAIVTALLGLIAIRFIAITQYPDIAPPQIYVSASYPGASASLIQDILATPIEQQVNGVDGMIYMSSSSSNSGSYSLTITFEIGTDPDIAAVNVQNRVALATPNLPASVIQQGITVTKQSGSMIIVANLISKDGSRDALYLSNYAADFLQEPLSRIPGVGSASQFGELEYSMRVWTRPDKMAALNITVADIETAIINQNVEATAGQVGAPPFGDQTTEFQYTLVADGLLKTVREFEDIIVTANSDGSIVRLSDIARIELGAENYSASSRFDGVASTSIAVYQESGANALEVANGVYGAFESLAKNFPEGVDYHLTFDVTKAVRVSIDEILLTLGLTACLVIAVTFMFLLSWRATIVPAIAIPVSLLGAFSLLYIVGFSANMITLFAIVLAITLVVDDAIVIVENAERIMDEEDLPPREATLKAMQQVTRPIIATTFVLAAVFVPVCFFPGITGKIYLQFALTIIFAFTLSAVNALTLGPALCSILLRRGSGKAWGIFKVIPAVIEWMRKIYLRGVRFTLRYLVVTLVVFLGVMAATAYQFSVIPTGFIPPEDNGVLIASVDLPNAASLSRTQAAMEKIEALTKDSPGVDSVTTISGFSMLGGAKPSSGLVIIVLDPWDERKSKETQFFTILETLNKQYATLPEATAYVFPIPSIQGLGFSGGVSAQLLDFNNGAITDLDAAKKALITAINASPDFSQAYSDFSADTPQYSLSIDRDRAETLGVEVSDIFTALQASLSSLYVNNFVKNGRVYWVVISADAEFRQSVEDIDNIYVNSANGDAIPLRVLIDEEPSLGADTLNRYNLFRTASISGQSAEGISSGQAIAALQALADKTLPTGYGLEWTDVSLQEVKAGGLVFYIMGLAIVFGYLFLVAQYESWLLPMAVMTSTVFAIFGAVLPLYLITGMQNNIYSQIGIVLLIGLAAKKAIMIVEFAKERREEGASIHEAALSAAKLRFRPVTMTGLCFIIGVLPLVLSSGAGANARISIGIPVLAGMIVDSTLGLLMVPSLYVAFQTLREKAKRWIHGEPAQSASA